MRNARIIRRTALAVLGTLVVVTAAACGPTPAPGSTTTTPGTSTTAVTSTTAPGSTTIPSGDVVLSENPVAGVPSGGSKAITVSWNNQTPKKVVYVDICRKPSNAPGFQPGEDCAPLSSQTPNGTASGSGSIRLDIFRGREPSGDLPWGCFAPGDTAPVGVEKNTTCYVRVTNDTLFNNDQARQAAFTLAG
jgi:hypothetical protein